jgi:hypothetical protein
VIGWIAEADAANSLPMLSTALGRPFANVAAFVEALKTQTREGGLKGDQVAYEMTVATLADHAPCLLRMRLLLQRMANACTELANQPNWLRDNASTERTALLRFVP